MDDTARQLEIITEQYYDEIFKYCRRRVNANDTAYDVTQNVFLALSERYLTIDKTKVRKWLYETAKNKIADYYRELQKKKDMMTDIPVQDLDAEQYHLSYDPFDYIDDSEIERISKNIVGNLGGEDKELYLDRYVKRMDYYELAKKHGTSEQNLRKRVSRLHSKIKKIVLGFLEMLIMVLS